MPQEHAHIWGTNKLGCQLIGRFHDDSADDVAHQIVIRFEDGAQVDAIVAYLYDSNVSHDLTLELRRKRVGLGSGTTALYTFDTSGSWGINNVLKAADLVVDNSLYHYYLKFCTTAGTVLSGDFRVYGVTFFYD